MVQTQHRDRHLCSLVIRRDKLGICGREGELGKVVGLSDASRRRCFGTLAANLQP